MHPLFEGFRREALDRLWDMFIIDAYIGNPDRNNGNWGVIIDKDDNVKLAPIYDNGNSLNEKWGPEKMSLLDSGTEKERLHLAMQTPSIYVDEKGHKIIPCSVIRRNNMGEECEKAIIRNVPKIKKAETEINEIIDNTPCLPEYQKYFYKTILHERLDKVFLPSYEMIKTKS